jgi:hypothetical protein
MRAFFCGTALISSVTLADGMLIGVRECAPLKDRGCLSGTPGEYIGVRRNTRARVNVTYGDNIVWSSVEGRGTASVAHLPSTPCTWSYTQNGMGASNTASDAADWTAIRTPTQVLPALLLDAGLSVDKVFGTCDVDSFIGAEADVSVTDLAVMQMEARSTHIDGVYRYPTGYANETGCALSFNSGAGANYALAYARAALRGDCTRIDPELPVVATITVDFSGSDYCVPLGGAVLTLRGTTIEAQPVPVVTQVIVRRSSTGAVVRRFFRYAIGDSVIVFSTDDSGSSVGYGSSDLVVEDIVSSCAGVDVEIIITNPPPPPNPGNCTAASVDTDGNNVVDWRDRTLYTTAIDNADPSLRPYLEGLYEAWHDCWVIQALCRADVAGSGQSSVPDGELTADDIIAYIGLFFADKSAADIAGAGQAPGPDGDLTADDIIVFINWFYLGCGQ